MERARRVALAVVLSLVVAGGSQASLDDGLNALRRNDFATAAKELRPLAERGDAEAQYRVGLMYEYGKGYPQDKAQGIAWFTKAASQGHAAAQQELGVIYTTGDGVAKDDAKSVAWFRKAAELGNPAAQYNLGLMIAKGTGIRRDDAQAVEWWRKSAAQGFALAQFKLGVAYENGEGVAKDPLLAYANYAIAARGGNSGYAAHRDAMASQLTPAQAHDGLALASAWTVGKPMPGGVAKGRGASASTAPHVDKCSASGQMSGEKFSATHCAVALYDDQHSVAIWFNEDPITPDEIAAFQVSSYAGGDKGGKSRTMLIVMFCPGGGAETAGASSVKTMDLNTNNANAAVAGIQWSVDAAKDFKVEKMAGDVKPGGVLTGKLAGSRGKTSWNIDFDIGLPARSAAAGLRCGP